MGDYPEQLIGFGSVDLSRSGAYVENTLDQLTHAPFRGIKLLSFSQFFALDTNENMDFLMSFCPKHIF